MVRKARSKKSTESRTAKFEESPRHWDRWKHVILTAENLLEETKANQNRCVEVELILKNLESVQEMFPKSLDPVDDLEGFAFRQFCRSLRHALEAYLEQITPDEHSLPSS